MTFNIINIIDESVTETSLKRLINEKLYKIIQLTEFNDNISKQML